MLFADVVRDFLLALTNEMGASRETRRTYQSQLHAFEAWATEQGIKASLDARFSLPTLRRYLYHLSSRKPLLRSRSIRNRFAALKSIGEWLVEQQFLESNPAKELKLPKRGAAERYFVSDHECRLLLDACERQADRKRVSLSRAMMSVLVYSGVRFSELIDLRLQDVRLDRKMILIAHGKGDRARELYPPTPCLEAISDWLVERAKMKPKHDWLWAYDIGRRMGDVGTRQMFSQIKAIAGLTDAKHTQPHAIRRGYATRRLEAGMPLKALQASLGHSMAETTLLYTQANEKAAKAMHDYAILQATPAPLTPLPSAPAHGGKSKPSRSASVMAVRRRLPSTTGGR